MYKEILKFFLALMHLGLAHFRLYMSQLFVHLSVIRQSNSQEPTTSTTINRTYLATFFAFGITCLYGTLGLHLEAGQALTLRSLRHSPYLMWRQFYLEPFWLPADTIWCFTIFSVLFLTLDFALKEIAEKYLFTIEWDTKKVKLGGKDVSPTESSQLVSMFRRFRIIHRLFFLTIYTWGILYIYSLVFFFSMKYFTTFFSLTFWFIVFNYLFSFFILFLFVNIIHIIIAGSCIQIRQQYLIEKFSRVLSKLTRKRPTVRRLKRVWLKYQAFNRSVLSIGLQLEAFNAFYTNYLTSIFLKYTVAQVMFAYIVFFISVDMAIIFVLKSLLVFIIFEMASLLFGLIQFCARVVKKNSRITKLNRQFAVHCLQHQPTYRLSARELLKIELFQWPRLLHFYAFKVFGGGRITSKTFYVMAINISCFFLFVMKRIH